MVSFIQAIDTSNNHCFVNVEQIRLIERQRFTDHDNALLYSVTIHFAGALDKIKFYGKEADKFLRWAEKSKCPSEAIT